VYTSRRTFLGVAAGLAAAAATRAAQMQTPVPPPMPAHPSPYGTDPNSSRNNNPFPAETPMKLNPREVLRANQEDIKKDVTRLTQLVSELQKGLDEGDTKDVLSIDVIHKTEEIEKLAKQIRSLIRA
jgi:hypothetical protein